MTTKLRHIDIHNHWLRQEVSAGRIGMSFTPSACNAADGFTKALSQHAFTWRIHDSHCGRHPFIRIHWALLDTPAGIHSVILLAYATFVNPSIQPLWQISTGASAHLMSQGFSISPYPKISGRVSVFHPTQKYLAGFQYSTLPKNIWQGFSISPFPKISGFHSGFQYFTLPKNIWQSFISFIHSFTD